MGKQNRPARLWSKTEEISGSLQLEEIDRNDRI
jgi:hypothetical protein